MRKWFANFLMNPKTSGETPEWVGEFLNRRTKVEKRLRDVKRGKADIPTIDECWDLANLLSIPSDFNQ